MELIPSLRAGPNHRAPSADHSKNPWHKIIDVSWASRSQLGKSLVADDRPLSVQTDMDKRWRRRSVARCVRTPTGSRSGRVPDLTSIPRLTRILPKPRFPGSRSSSSDFPKVHFPGFTVNLEKSQFPKNPGGSSRRGPEGVPGGPDLARRDGTQSRWRTTQ